MEKEILFRAAQPFEVRAADADGAGIKVSGHAAVFNQAADIAGIYKEIIAATAFDGRLGDDVRFLINHEGLPLARVASGTLALSIDARGLYIEAELDPSDPDVQRIVPKMKRKDLVDMSFAFRVAEDEWDHTGEMSVRTVTKLDLLIDVSIVTDGAYSGTDIALRSLEVARAAVPQNSHTALQRRMQMTLAATETS